MDEGTATNRILVVDDDNQIIGEYMRCLGSGFEPDIATSTLGDLEKVLFGEETDETGAVRFDVQSCQQGEAAVAAVQQAVDGGTPYSIVFIDIRMPPGIDGIRAAKLIREIDPNVNIVVVTGSLSPEPDNLGGEVPPADRIFFFKKPFHAVECRQLAAALCGKWHADLALRRANDVLEQRVKDRTEALHKLAYFDPVTKLPNRLKLVDELQLLIEKAERAGTDTAVVVLDLERFSFLNETMGYDSGTELLNTVGRRLEKFCLDLEASQGSVVGRFGADEFACLIPGIRDAEMLERIVEDMIIVVEEPFLVDGRDIFLKASIGVATHPAHGEDAKSVFRAAEAALHRSMRKLQGRVTYYRREMQHRAQSRFDMEAELRNAMDNGDIIAWFQPQLCLKSGKIAGVEALARWVREDGTVVPPAQFVPLSEEMGVSDVLFETVMRYVCSAVSRWQQESGWDIPVSVNLSAHQLRNHKLVDTIKAILRKQKVEQKLINLELTETALLEDLTIARPLLMDLSFYGVGIHIDDFGTGYSSLSYLAELPVQTLKIDRSFVERLSESTNNARVVQAIIALGKAMELSVIAEGIETEQQLMLVHTFGCDLAQGFFIGKPMQEQEFLDWVYAVDQTTNDLQVLPELSRLKA
ncbi:MAG: EAL domain-containing protein [Woeseiaceae bacterium]|nr:EAL domain-containing protein [Woeseiaceae bacterium]